MILFWAVLFGVVVLGAEVQPFEGGDRGGGGQVDLSIGSCPMSKWTEEKL